MRGGILVVEGELGKGKTKVEVVGKVDGRENGRNRSWIGTVKSPLQESAVAEGIPFLAQHAHHRPAVASVRVKMAIHGLEDVLVGLGIPCRRHCC